ncbi:MAG: hypothetical protein KAG61_13675, partial [Bacteriovoracaceae bacterium]|nr:hypothetical protein [Bacteriovoracaceae bacterium]
MKKSVFPPLTSILLIISMIGLTGCLDSGRSGYPSVEKFSSNDGDNSDTTSPTLEIMVRPSGVISVSNYCVCKAGLPLVINNCASECASRPSTDSTMLYVKTTLGPEITTNTTLKNLDGWCNTDYGENNAAPNCSLRVYDELFTSQTLKIESISGETNSYVVNLSTGNVQLGRRYKFQLIENQSGALSQMNGFKIEEIDTSDNGIRPLRLDLINLYSCVARAGDVQTGVNNFDSAVKMNFFFAASDRPEPMPPNERFTLCHDPYADGQGEQDKIEYSR